MNILIYLSYAKNNIVKTIRSEETLVRLTLFENNVNIFKLIYAVGERSVSPG
jgi:hypothetical protein